MVSLSCSACIAKNEYPANVTRRNRANNGQIILAHGLAPPWLVADRDRDMVLEEEGRCDSSDSARYAQSGAMQGQALQLIPQTK